MPVPASIRTFPYFRAGFSVLALGILALLAGCNIIPPPLGDPTRYYVLDGPPLRAGADPAHTLKRRLDEFVEFHLNNPAYVRLSLVDFATPEGGTEYVTLAAGGPMQENPHSGPLAIMHRHLAALLEAGRKTHQFRAVGPLDFYRIVKSVLLIRLVFPDDALLTGKPSPAQVLEVKAHLWDLARRYLAPNAGVKTVQRPPRRQKRASVARA